MITKHDKNLDLKINIHQV